MVVLQAAGDLAAFIIERQARAQVDRAAEASFDHFRGRVLVDVDATEQLGRHVLEAQAAAVIGGEDVTAIELGAHLGQATDGDGAAFAVVARDLDAGDALQRFGDVVVGQFADVLSHDRIDDLLGILFDLLGTGHAAAGTRHLDGVQLGRGIRVLDIALLGHHLPGDQHRNADRQRTAAQRGGGTCRHGCACRPTATTY